MYKILRIICCVIAALAAAGCIFVFIYGGIIWGVATVIGGAAFFALTILFKSLQEDYDKKHPVPEKQGNEEPEKQDNENKE